MGPPSRVADRRASAHTHASCITAAMNDDDNNNDNYDDDLRPNALLAVSVKEKSLKSHELE